MSYPTPSLSWSDIRQALKGFYPGKPKFTEKDYPSFDGKVVIVTGGNNGVGYETAKSLVGSTNARVYVFARNEEKSLAAIKQIELDVAKEYTKQKPDIHFIRADLADLTTIKPAVEKFLSLETRLDIIIHNAGIMNKEVEFTKQGYEAQLGTNAIGPHLLQRLLDPIFIETAKSNKPNESRVVWVSSTAHQFAPKGGLNWDDLEAKHEKAGTRLYGQSKALNAIQAIQWPNAYPEASGIVSVSLCPGYLRSGLVKNKNLADKFLSNFFYPQRLGAYTELYGAFSPDLTTKKNGAHIIAFGNIATLRKDILQDVPNQKKVWNWLDEQIKPYL